MKTINKPFDVVVVGEINPDLVLKGNIEPAYGQVEQMVDEADLVIGSSAAIFAFGAVRLGLKVAFIGKAGNDLFGRFMLEGMKQHGIDTSGIVMDAELKTGISVLLTRGNDRCILTYSGTIGALRYSEIDWNVIKQARHLHIGSFYLLDNLRKDIPRLYAQAKDLGMTTSLDTNYDPLEVWDDHIQETLKFTDIFLPNEKELLMVSGTDSVQAGLDRLSNTVPLVAVKLGKHGAMVRQGQEVFTAPPIKVNVADTIGAGDTFDAGFIYGFLNNWGLEKTLHLANTCGALSTQGTGGTSAQPDLAEASSYF